MTTIKMDRRELLMGLATGSVVAFTPGCAENMALGRSQLMLVSDDQISEMSTQAWNESLRQERVSRDPALRRRVERVGRKIVEASGQTHLDWEFVVFDSDSINAWVLPNGKVGFYRGILDVMDNDAQVATVMGHEAGHVAGRHAAERASQQMAAGVGIGLAALALDSADVDNSAVWAAVLGAGVTFGVVLPYSRRHEYEADRLGLQFMEHADYNPVEALTFWNGMSGLHSTRSFEFMSTHPSDAHRIEAMTAYLTERGLI